MKKTTGIIIALFLMGAMMVSAYRGKQRYIPQTEYKDDNLHVIAKEMQFKTTDTLKPKAYKSKLNRITVWFNKRTKKGTRLTATIRENNDKYIAGLYHNYQQYDIKNNFKNNEVKKVRFEFKVYDPNKKDLKVIHITQAGKKYLITPRIKDYRRYLIYEVTLNYITNDTLALVKRR